MSSDTRIDGATKRALEGERCRRGARSVWRAKFGDGRLAAACRQPVRPWSVRNALARIAHDILLQL
jgi:hypothetical protein